MYRPLEADNFTADPAVNLESHRNTSENAALYHGRRGVHEIWQKFQVVVVQQVLSANREFQIFYRLPAQVRIQRVVRASSGRKDGPQIEASCLRRNAWANRPMTSSTIGCAGLSRSGCPPSDLDCPNSCECPFAGSCRSPTAS